MTLCISVPVFTEHTKSTHFTAYSTELIYSYSCYFKQAVLKTSMLFQWIEKKRRCIKIVCLKSDKSSVSPEQWGVYLPLHYFLSADSPLLVKKTHRLAAIWKLFWENEKTPSWPLVWADTEKVSKFLLSNQNYYSRELEQMTTTLGSFKDRCSVQLTRLQGTMLTHLRILYWKNSSKTPVLRFSQYNHRTNVVLHSACSRWPYL